MKIKNHRDFWAGLLFLVAGIGFSIMASNLTLGGSADPGPGFFPLLLSLLMTLLGCLIIFKSLTFETDDGGPIGPVAWQPLTAIFGSVVVFGFAAPVVGVLLILPAVAFIIGRAFGGLRQALLTGLLTGVLTAGLGWVVFTLILGVPLPMLPALPG